MKSDSKVLRPVWAKRIQFAWPFALLLVLLVCIPRFYLVLKANETGSYGAIGMVMLVSALIPFVFLNRNGLRDIGIRKPTRLWSLIPALLAGILFSLVLFVIGNSLYGSGVENWYVYIGNSYNIPVDIGAADKRLLFVIMAGTGMVFSPIGEEFFFRGIVHGAFAASLGSGRASLLDAAAFALTHLAHFGLVHLAGAWHFLPVPALIWVTGMFLASLLFFKMKQVSGSIWGAVLCHSGFNLGMIYCIFYLL